MSFLPEGTLSGRHHAMGNPSDAQVRLALEFSHRPEHMAPGRPNIEIAQRLDLANKELPLPVFASLSIVRALEYIRSDLQVAERFKGPSASGTKENTGTQGELDQSKELMAAYGFNRPEIWTSRFNIGNVVIQARAIGLEPIVPGNLPGSFDPESDQLWTRNRMLWTALAVPRIYKIRRNQH